MSKHRLSATETVLEMVLIHRMDIRANTGSDWICISSQSHLPLLNVVKRSFPAAALSFSSSALSASYHISAFAANHQYLLFCTVRDPDWQSS